jgi:hypothetical protein
MSELDLNTSLIGRRGFLRACAVLSLGVLTFGFARVVARSSADKSGFVVINGWVLPAQYFR